MDHRTAPDRSRLAHELRARVRQVLPAERLARAGLLPGAQDGREPARERNQAVQLAQAGRSVQLDRFRKVASVEER